MFIQYYAVVPQSFF